MHPDDWRTLLFRLVLALVAGGLIGWDRQVTGKPAGLRTHMLVALGAALFLLVPMAAGASPDALSRAVQGVAVGVGFLGAGEIVHRSVHGSEDALPKNLSSAAALWVTAGLGIGAAYGLWQLLAIATALTLLTLTVLKKIEPQPHHHDDDDDDAAGRR